MCVCVFFWFFFAGVVARKRCLFWFRASVFIIRLSLGSGIFHNLCQRSHKLSRAIFVSTRMLHDKYTPIDRQKWLVVLRCALCVRMPAHKHSAETNDLHLRRVWRQWYSHPLILAVGIATLHLPDCVFQFLILLTMLPLIALHSKKEIQSKCVWCTVYNFHAIRSDCCLPFHSSRFVTYIVKHWRLNRWLFFRAQNEKNKTPSNNC